MTSTIIGGSAKDYPDGYEQDLQENELHQDRRLIAMCRGVNFKWYLPGWPFKDFFIITGQNAAHEIDVKPHLKSEDVVTPIKILDGEKNNLALKKETIDWTNITLNPNMLGQTHLNMLYYENTNNSSIPSRHVFYSFDSNTINRMRCFIIAVQVAQQIKNRVDLITKSILKNITEFIPEAYDTCNSFEPLMEAKEILMPQLEEILAHQKMYEKQGILSQKIIDSAIAAYAPFVPYVAADELANTP